MKEKDNILFSAMLIKPEVEQLTKMIETLTNTESLTLTNNIFFHDGNGKRVFVINCKYTYDMEYDVTVRKL